MKRFLATLSLAVLFAFPARAHVGSPDIFLEGNAGPYRLFVTVRVPQVIPGIAQIEIRSESDDVSEIRLTPMQLTGPGSQFAPTPDVAQRSATDPQFFTGSLWLMEFGSLQVRVRANGARGSGDMAVPVPAVAQRMLPMRKPLGMVLFTLMLVLAFAMVSIVSAAVREGNLKPGAVPPLESVRRSRVAMIVAAVALAAVLFVGERWWQSDANRYARNIYSPPELQAQLEPGGQLILQEAPVSIASGNPRQPATTIDFNHLLLDHGHLMHFFMIRTPRMDSFWHLHPRRASGNGFALSLPPVPAGHYQIFADIVLSSGFPVTLVGKLDVPESSGQSPLNGDDSGILAKPLVASASPSLSSELPDGGRMIWQHDSGSFRAGVPFLFRFRAEDANGEPARDLEPYMGMAAHAEIVRSDGSVFAHIHPAGSVSMAALEMAQSGLSGNPAMNMPGMSLSSMNMPAAETANMQMSGPVSPDISFPYGFPKPGLYRIFVQIKRSGQVETAFFDVSVT